MSEPQPRTVAVRVSIPGEGWVLWEVKATEAQIQACYDLPKDASRAAYWSKLIGDPLPEGTALIWTV